MTNFFAAGIDVTNKCTLRCLHCFNSSGGLKNQRMDEMSDEELELLAPWNETVKAEIERRANESNQSYVNCQGAQATEK